MYTVGTYLLYRSAGVCRVEGMDAPKLARDEKRQYYKLRPAFSTGLDYIYVPLDSPVPLRPIISSEKAVHYLDSVAFLKPKAAGMQKTAEISAHYQNLLSTGDPENSLLVIKEIWEKEKGLTGTGGKRKLNQADVKYRRLAEKLVCEEFAAALHTDPEAMKERLYRAMERKAEAPAVTA